MSTKDRFEEIVRKDLEVRAGDETYDRMHRIVLAAHGPTDRTKIPTFARRLLMDKPVVKLAIAAAVVAAVVLGLFEFVTPGGSSGVVWADVAKKVETSQGFISRTRQTQTVKGMDRPMTLCTTTYSSSQGSRMENYQGDKPTVTTYSDYASGEVVSLLHPLKQYTRMTMPPMNTGGGGASMDPRGMVRSFLAGDYRKLGRRTIEGMEAEGIEVTKIPNSMANFTIDSQVAQLWVSVQTGYPILFDSTILGNGGDLKIETVIDQFQWNVELDPNGFKAKIPPDYTQMAMPQP